MKKVLIKTIVFLAVFVVSLLVTGKMMNQGNENLTMEMSEAALPVITMYALSDWESDVQAEGVSSDKTGAGYQRPCL